MLPIFLTFKTCEEKQRFEQLYKEHQQKLFKYAMKMVNDIPAAEDAVQDTFIKISKNMEKVCDIPDSKIVYYMIAILKHTVLDIIKRQKGETERFVSYEENISTGGELANITYNSTHYNEILEALQYLDSKYRDPFIFMYIYGFETKEIASQLSIKESLVGTRVQRAKDKIRNFLSERN